MYVTDDEGVRGEGGSFPKRGAWSATKTLTARNASITLSLQAVFERAETYTVCFSYRRLSPVVVGAVSPINPTAEITWSVEGNDYVRRVSVASGVSISGAGQAVRVKVFDETADPLQVGSQYEVSVQIVPGTRATTIIPPTLIGTLIPVGIAVGSPLILPIPNGVGISSVLVLQDTRVPFTLVQLGAAGYTQLSWAQSQNEPLWMPVPPGAEVISVSVVGAGAPNVTVTFGIDG